MKNTELNWVSVGVQQCKNPQHGVRLVSLGDRSRMCWTALLSFAFLTPAGFDKRGQERSRQSVKKTTTLKLDYFTSSLTAVVTQGRCAGLSSPRRFSHSVSHHSSLSDLAAAASAPTFRHPPSALLLCLHSKCLRGQIQHVFGSNGRQLESRRYSALTSLFFLVPSITLRYFTSLWRLQWRLWSGLCKKSLP